MSAARKRARAAAPRRIPASPAARLSIWIWAAYAITQGFRIILGGPQRWDSASFDILRLAPQPTLTWGLVLITLGSMLLASSLLRIFWLKAVGCIGIAIWSLCFAYGAFLAAAENPITPNTGGTTYAAIAFAVLVLVFVEERGQRPHVRDGAPRCGP